MSTVTCNDMRANLVNAALLAGHDAQCTPDGQSGMKCTRLLDGDGTQVGTFYYSISEESPGGRRIIYVEPHYVQSANGHPQSLVEDVAAQALCAFVERAAGRNLRRAVYVCWGIKPADRAQQRLWTFVDADLRGLVRRTRGLFPLEDAPGCKRWLQCVADPADVGDSSR